MQHRWWIIIWVEFIVYCSPLFSEVFLKVLLFSCLLKSQHYQIPYLTRKGTLRTTTWIMYLLIYLINFLLLNHTPFFHKTLHLEYITPCKVTVEIRGLMLLLLPLSPRWTLSVSLRIHVCLRELTVLCIWFSIASVLVLHRGYYKVVRRYEFYFRVAKQYLKYCFCHEKIQFISSSCRVMFFLLYRQKDIDKINNRGKWPKLRHQ